MNFICQKWKYLLKLASQENLPKTDTLRAWNAYQKRHGINTNQKRPLFRQEHKKKVALCEGNTSNISLAWGWNKTSQRPSATLTWGFPAATGFFCIYGGGLGLWQVSLLCLGWRFISRGSSASGSVSSRAVSSSIFRFRLPLSKEDCR